MDAPRSITFTASLPPIQSAISMDGYGDGARIKLDIPAVDAGAVLLLQHYFAGKSFQVTIEATDDLLINNTEQKNGKRTETTRMEKRQKRQSEWTPAEKSRPD
jgi:hypothetical protein